MAYIEYRPTRPLYQYCSLDALRGIIGSKRLRFSDLAGANDPREVRMGHAKFIAAIRHNAANEAHAGRRNYLYILSDKLTVYANNTRAYCACFSLARDSLPMWATYGGQHGGVLIGFRPTALFGIPARIQLVKYVDEQSNDDYRDLLVQALRDVDMSYPPDNILNTMPPVVGAFVLMTAHKHLSWAYEHEVRMIHVQRISPPALQDHEFFSRTGVLPDGAPIRWSQPLERASRAGPLHYFEFPFGRYRNGIFDPTRAIAEVIVGPKCTVSTVEIASLFTDHGFKGVAVVRSQCQIR